MYLKYSMTNELPRPTYKLNNQNNLEEWGYLYYSDIKMKITQIHQISDQLKF